jgi:hypothetical protein
MWGSNLLYTQNLAACAYYDACNRCLNVEPAALPGVNYTSGQQLVTPDYAKTYQLAHQFDKNQISWCEVKLGPGQLITGAIGVHDMATVYSVNNPETNVSCAVVPDTAHCLQYKKCSLNLCWASCNSATASAS